MRLTLLAVPPLLPLIHRDLRLSEAAVGALNGLPVLLFATMAIPGSLLISHVGARRALIAGLVVLASAGALRGLGESPVVLFGMTVVMGAGIAVCQPTLPTLVKRWLPDRVGLATASYSNGFLIGEILPASLTVGLVVPLVGDWVAALAFWSIPVFGTALLVTVATPHADPRAHGEALWWPDWDARTLRVGFLLGCASVTYFGCNAFIPDYLKATHQPHLIGAALTSLNLVQLPASLMVAFAPGAFLSRRWPFAAAGIFTLVGLAGFLSLQGYWLVAAAGLLGLCAALVFMLALALPPLLVETNDVPRLSAAIFTVSYSCSFVGPVLGGVAWDFTGIPATAYAPVLLAGLGLIALPAALRFPRQDGDSGGQPYGA